MTAEECAEAAAMWAAKSDQWDAELAAGAAWNAARNAAWNAARYAARYAAGCAEKVAHDS